MTINQINCFVEVCKTGNLSRAAENLFISQQAVSYQLSALEKELGFKVFVRHQKGVSLTKEGEILFADWTDALEKIRISVDKASDLHAGTKKNIRIAIEDMGNCSEDIMNAVLEYRKKYADLHIEVEIISPVNIFRQLKEENLDIAILYESEFENLNFFKCLPLHTKPLKVCIFMSKSHPLSQKKDLSIADLSNETIGILSSDYSLDFKKQVNRFFRGNGAERPQNFKEFASRRDLEIALISGGCVTVVYETMFIDEVNKLFSKEINSEKMSSHMAVFWKKDEVETKARALRDILKERLKRYN